MATPWKLAALLLFLPVAWTQRCSYFTAVPRDETPEFPDQDFTDVPWSTRPLLPPPHREDICMEDYSSNVGVQIIYIEEEIIGHVIVAKLNYNGEGEPTVGAFFNGARSQLGATCTKLPGDEDIDSDMTDLEDAWYLVITERQDYETPSMRQYIFNVDVWEPSDNLSPTGRIIVSLNIVNIDDNPPIIHLIDDCVVPELGEPRATECIYEVTDVDGAISTIPMYFTVEGSRDEHELFTFDEERFVNDPYRMVITLRIERPLDFAARALHIFMLTAFDSLPNKHEVTMLVQVENVEHRPPRWVEIWAMQQFDEKSHQTFTVSALDGDTGIDKQILYRLNVDENYDFFHIDQESGVFTVSPIDRDELEQEIFQLQIIAYKFDNDMFNIASNVIIIVDDINDQIPVPLRMEYEIDILEETPMSLSFEDFGFHDRDLGENAQYTVHLVSVFPPEVATAFTVAPDQGYQRQNFIMSVFDHARLDYDDVEVDYKNIVLEFMAVENKDPTHTGSAVVRVNLINWNDEEPIFEQQVKEVTLLETVEAGHPVATMRAWDRDVGDTVVHSLMGNAASFLDIDPETGEITVSVDDAFDYLRQNEIFVQVRADDTLGDGPYHTATAQLIIKLIDVNNNPPQLRLPRVAPMVEENVPDGHIITTEIHGTDPDTTADIFFEIEWETTWASKQGRQVDPAEYVGCVEILTIYPDENDRGTATGTIVVRELVGRPGVTIDFEEFEVLYLTIRVVDRNQVIGDDYADSAFTIIIIDMNDNWPIWTPSTIETEFSVREVSLEGVVIGSVHATDIDGPIYNQIRYSIVPINDTPENLVRIDPLMGQIEVLTSGAIDADVPPRQNLYFRVIASDCCTVDCPPADPTCWETPAYITVSIIDTNNKIPEVLVEEFDQVVYVWENATTGEEFLQMFAHDLDRDEVYHTVAYEINYAVNPGLRDFFQIDLETGVIMVYYTSDRVLDRDRGEPTHDIFVNVFDNYFSGDGNRNQPPETIINVILIDVNDNAPQLDPRDELGWTISEELTAGSILRPEIDAPDIDEPGNVNSKVNYRVEWISLLNREIEPPKLFDVINVDNVTGELYCTQDLRGYWGTYDIHIVAYDLGHPQQSSEETYELVVEPYNFHDPVFVYPAAPGSTIRLARELAIVTWPLTMVNGDFLDRMSATDEDGLEAGLVTFAVTGNALAQEYFTADNDGVNMATLRLLEALPENQNEFVVTITATDQGRVPGPRSASTNIRLVYVATQGDPVFSLPTDTAAFFEFEEGLAESAPLRIADDPKNAFCDGDCHDIYYHIFDGNDAGHFSLDSQTNVLRVVSPLDRSEADTHQLIIGATNSATRPVLLPGSDSLLTVTINVREANPQPRFQQELYTAGISTLDTINRELLTVAAIHSDGDTITYTIDLDSMVVDSSLELVRDSAFVLDQQTGVLRLNIQPTASMHGMFEFDVIATDTAGVTDTTQVKIYIISSMNRVFFTFVNTLTQVEEQSAFIAQTLSIGFEMTCHIDQILPASDDSGLAQEERTEVRAHFIEDDLPVGVEVIELKREDIALLRQIQNTLSLNMLILSDLFTGTPPDTSGPSIERVMQNILAVVAAVLAVLCILLALTYIFKTRALNRRLKAMSTTVMEPIDSKESNLSPAGMVVPNTNKHAQLGSNPVWNEETKAPDFDALSNISYGSDLIGIEDNPYFSYESQPGRSDSRIGNMNESIGPAQGSSSAFDFGTRTPFVKEFGNRDIMRKY